MDTNYTPDEIRLLDEFAAAFSAACSKNHAFPGLVAMESYNVAAAMIAERRKRMAVPVPAEVDQKLSAIKSWAEQAVNLLPPCGYRSAAHLMLRHVTGEEVLPPSPLDTATTAQPTPAKPVVQRGGPVPQTALDRITEEQITEGLRAVAEGRTVSVSELRKECAEPEKGELTEEAVDGWERYARFDEAKDDGYWLGESEIRRAVALMREGLAAKRERDEARAESAKWESAYQQGRDYLECDALRARAEKAEAALAEAQPVLDAVVSNFDKHGEVWNGPPFTTLQAYADRRREQAKGAS